MKTLFASKTFWANVLALAAHYAVDLPPKYAVPVLAVVNIALRYVTSESVRVP